jgi:hypothetical protein
MFSRRHEWFHHELQAHRQAWKCAQGCPGSFGTQTQFEAHAREQHPELTSPELLVALSNLSVMPLNGDTPTECSFCHQQDMTLSKLERHLGRHQESLALFAMPPIVQEDDGTDEDEEDDPKNRKRSSEGEMSSQGNDSTLSEDPEIQKSNAQILFDTANLRQAGKSSMVATASILRQFQLTIQAFQVLNKKALTTPRYLKYNHDLQGLRRTLETENVMYRSSCDRLLDQIDVTAEQKNRMLVDPSLNMWGHRSLEEQLHKISPKWYGSYVSIIEDMKDAFSRISNLLSLGPDGKVSHHGCTDSLKLYIL